MQFEKQKRSEKEFGYYLLIEVESREDENSLLATLDYLIAKKNKPFHAAKGKIVTLPKMLRRLITE